MKQVKLWVAVKGIYPYLLSFHLFNKRYSRVGQSTFPRPLYYRPLKIGPEISKSNWWQNNFSPSMVLPLPHSFIKSAHISPYQFLVPQSIKYYKSLEKKLLIQKCATG